MEIIKIYIVYNEEGKQRGIGFSKAEAWCDAMKCFSNPAQDVIKSQDKGWQSKEYTLLK